MIRGMKPTPPPTGPYTPQEVAALRRVKVDTVYGWIDAGLLPATNEASVKSTRPRWRIEAEDLEAFKRRRRSTATTATTAPPAPSTGVKRRRGGRVYQ
jgi:excisionase family DNA binding protein